MLKPASPGLPPDPLDNRLDGGVLVGFIIVVMAAALFAYVLGALTWWPSAFLARSPAKVIAASPWTDGQ